MAGQGPLLSRMHERQPCRIVWRSSFKVEHTLEPSISVQCMQWAPTPGFHGARAGRPSNAAAQNATTWRDQQAIIEEPFQSSCPKDPISYPRPKRSCGIGGKEV